MGCMCMECRFLQIVEDENSDLFSICAEQEEETGMTAGKEQI